MKKGRDALHHPGPRQNPTVWRSGSRPAKHLVRLRALQDTGRLVLAGPLPAIDSLDPGSRI